MTIVLFQLKIRLLVLFFYQKFAFVCLIHPEHLQLAQALKIHMSHNNIHD